MAVNDREYGAQSIRGAGTTTPDAAATAGHGFGMPGVESQIRVLLVDDHPVVRMGVAAGLGGCADIEVVGEARDIASMVEGLRGTEPDVVVLDLQLEGGEPVEGLTVLRGEVPDARVIVYTAHDDAETIVQVVEMGVQGYLLKSAGLNDLVNAIRVVFAGGTLLQPCVATKLVESMRRGRSNGAAAPAANLSLRECEVLRLVAQGKSNRQIASALFISERTVKYHVSSILGKLDAANRTEAVLAATRMGLVGPEYGA